MSHTVRAPYSTSEPTTTNEQDKATTMATIKQETKANLAQKNGHVCDDGSQGAKGRQVNAQHEGGYQVICKYPSEGGLYLGQPTME